MDMADGKSASAAWPSEICVNDLGRSLSITFAGGDVLTLSAELLRFASPSVEPRRTRQEEMRGVAIVGVVTLVTGADARRVSPLETVEHYSNSRSEWI